MSTHSESGQRPVDGRGLPIDRLRAFLTALVVTHHAVLAYHVYAPKPEGLVPGLMVWGAFPVVDSARWPGIDGLVAFNDSFFMALMFLLAGLFLPQGIARRGAGGYLRERAWRLGVPFALAAGVLAPLAYAATYAQGATAPSLGGFVKQWLALGAWPAGPAWFLWVLLAFGVIAVALTALAPSWPKQLERSVFGDGTRPWRAYVGFAAAGLLVYVPTAMTIDPMDWSSFGPFFVQTARVPLYLLYFLGGAALAGQHASRQGLFDPAGKLARRWILWSSVAPVIFVALIAVFLVLLSVLQKGGEITALKFACDVLFVLSSAATSFAFIAFFVRKSERPNRVWESLSANAFGIYVLHYPIVTWLQYAMLPVPWPGYAKGLFVIAVSLGASWLITAALRRIGVVERIIGRGKAPRSAL